MKKLLISITIILFAILLIGAFVYANFNKPYSEIINMNWSIKLPKDYKEIYSTDSGPSFHGDGTRYHIFQYSSSNDIDRALDWANDKNAEMESKVTEILKRLIIPIEYAPDFQNQYRYFITVKKGPSTIYFIFVPTSKKLYIIEDIL